MRDQVRPEILTSKRRHSSPSLENSRSMIHSVPGATIAGTIQPLAVHVVHALGNDAGRDAALAQSVNDVEGAAVRETVALVLGQDDEHLSLIDAGGFEGCRIIEPALELDDERIVL